MSLLKSIHWKFESKQIWVHWFTTIVLFSKHHLSLHTRTHVCEIFDGKLVIASDRKIALAGSSQIYSRTSLKVNILYLHAINMNLRGSYIIYFRCIGNLFIFLHDLLCLLLENRKLHSCSAYVRLWSSHPCSVLKSDL